MIVCISHISEIKYGPIGVEIQAFSITTQSTSLDTVTTDEHVVTTPESPITSAEYTPSNTTPDEQSSPHPTKPPNSSLEIWEIVLIVTFVCVVIVAAVILFLRCSTQFKKDATRFNSYDNKSYL